MPARRSSRDAALAAILLSLGLGAAWATSAVAAEGSIEGSGSTTSREIMDAWIADLHAQGTSAAYVGSGSTQGRRDFANVVVDFAVTDLPYLGTDELGRPDSADGRELTYVPLTGSGLAFTYHLEGPDGTLLTGVRLSGDTITRIFTEEITSWADPAIAADNNWRELPDVPVVPVVRADRSGTTRVLTEWLDAEHADVWRAYDTGGPTGYFPVHGSRTVSAAGSDMLVNTVRTASGNGTIGYVEAAYPQAVGLPVAKILNDAGFYVAPTALNVAVALTGVQVRSAPGGLSDGTADLTGAFTHADPRAYPLSSYEYLVLPTGQNDRGMSTGKRQSLVDLTAYALCEGQARAAALGRAPLPLNLVQDGLGRLAALGDADEGVDLSGAVASACHSPTFDPADLSRDVLDEITPMPQPCDQEGHGPCGRTDVALVAQIPIGSGRGELSLTVPAGENLVLAGERDPGNNRVSASGDLANVVVRDTRAAPMVGWEVCAQVATFEGLYAPFSAEYLGWRPWVPQVQPGPGSDLQVQAGTRVRSRLDEPTSDGLSIPTVLARAVTAGSGTVNLGATLDLAVPGSTMPGTYTSTLTLTLVSD